MIGIHCSKNVNLQRFIASNLDEFFMIRVSRLFDHVAAGFNLPDNKSGMKRKSTANTSFVNKPINNQKVLKSEGLKKLQLLKS